MKRAACFLLVLFLLFVPTAARGAEGRLRFGGSIIVQPGETIGDATCFFCSIRVLGNVEGDAVSIGGGIEVEGNLAGDAVAAGGGIRVGARANVAGDVVAIGGGIERDTGANIAGDVVAQRYSYFPGQRQLLLPGLLVLIGFDLLLGAVSYLILRRRRVENLAATIRARRGLTVLAGVGVFVVFSVLFSIFDLRIMRRVESPADTVLSIIAVVIFAAGYAGVCTWVGNSVVPGRHPLVAVLLGAAIVTLLLLIPIVGFLAFVLIALFALGSTALSRFGSTRFGVLPHPIAPSSISPPPAI